MPRNILLALAFGFLLVAAPLVRAHGDDHDDDDDDEGAAGGDEEKDVVVLTEKNFDEIIKASKFALVSTLIYHVHIERIGSMFCTFKASQ